MGVDDDDGPPPTPANSCRRRCSRYWPISADGRMRKRSSWPMNQTKGAPWRAAEVRPRSASSAGTASGRYGGRRRSESMMGRSSTCISSRSPSSLALHTSFRADRQSGGFCSSAIFAWTRAESEASSRRRHASSRLPMVPGRWEGENRNDEVVDLTLPGVQTGLQTLQWDVVLNQTAELLILRLQRRQLGHGAAEPARMISPEVSTSSYSFAACHPPPPKRGPLKRSRKRKKRRKAKMKVREKLLMEKKEEEAQQEEAQGMVFPIGGERKKKA
ncbi:hypothetical protein TYRP_002852 [Tyrophagus putrescentiae]|nr:hypothetical protein TYRP_002852 [Tyrophagus putrescentiae]